MSNEKTISRSYFEKRLIDLCVRSGMTEFPKKATDQHILLMSAALTLRGDEAYTEAEINEKLTAWLEDICPIAQLDFVTLRRALVDEGYLLRPADGSRYELAAEGPAQSRFEEGVGAVDVAAVIAAGREDIERRRRLYGGGASGRPGAD